MRRKPLSSRSEARRRSRTDQGAVDDGAPRSPAASHTSMVDRKPSSSLRAPSWSDAPSMAPPRHDGEMNDPFDRSFRDRTLAGETLFGLFMDLASPASAELCAAAGYDWLLVDLEHGAST